MNSFFKLFFFIDCKFLSFFFIDFENNIINYYTYWGAEYSFTMVFIFLSLILTVILFLVSFCFSTKSMGFEKGSPYECGFEPFEGDAHTVFHIQYIIVGILFMLFDLELAYLFVWVLYLGILSWFSFWLIIFFLFLLVIGFIYEWQKGALDWL